MEESDRKGFLILMAMISEAFKEEVSTERAKIYFEFLKPYSLYRVMDAIKYSIRHLKFFPKISELTDVIDPKDKYTLIESEESNRFRLKKENTEMVLFMSEISKIMGKTKAIPLKRISYKE